MCEQKKNFSISPRGKVAGHFLTPFFPSSSPSYRRMCLLYMMALKKFLSHSGSTFLFVKKKNNKTFRTLRTSTAISIFNFHHLFVYVLMHPRCFGNPPLCRKSLRERSGGAWLLSLSLPGSAYTFHTRYE